MTRVAVIGTGVIGAGIAVNLLRNGHDVTVWNRTPERAADVVTEGAKLARDACGGGGRGRRRVRGDRRRRVVAVRVAR